MDLDDTLTSLVVLIYQTARWILAVYKPSALCTQALPPIHCFVPCYLSCAKNRMNHLV